MHSDDNRTKSGSYFIDGEGDVFASVQQQIEAGALPTDGPTAANFKLGAHRFKSQQVQSDPLPYLGPAMDVTDGLERVLDSASAAVRLAFRFFPFVVPLLILSRYSDRYIPFGMTYLLMNLLRWASVPLFIYQAVRGVVRLSRRSDKAENRGIGSRPIYERIQLPDGKVAVTFRQRRLNFVAADIVTAVPVIGAILAGLAACFYVAVNDNLLVGVLLMPVAVLTPMLVVHRLNWRTHTITIEPGVGIRSGSQLVSYKDVYDFGWQASQRTGKGGYLSMTDSVAYAMMNGGKKVLLTKEMRGNTAASICGLIRELA
ncbi:hypothetical protein PQQ86_15370 [Paraburkholderia sediminicola]|uniref:hypothetical protein n=1 Tax=Paraburkholderia sediminicola TaxID=458836 RepID=UPI0038BD066A